MIAGQNAYRWNGTSFKRALPTVVGKVNDLVLIPGTNHLWAVGKRTSGASLTLLWNGTAWEVISSPAIGDLSSVAAISATNAWAVGAGGSMHFH